MDREVQERHRRRWMIDGEADSDYALNQAIENFNELVDNMLAPTVHRVQYTQPLNYLLNHKSDDNVVISDVTRQEQIQDVKLLHVKLISKIDSGSLIYWNDECWVVLNEEHNAVRSHRTYSIARCAINVNIQYENTFYSYPVAVRNLTIYADGMKELVNLTVSSAKYSIQIVENEITNLIKEGTRFIIRDKAFEVSVIDDFTMKNIRTATICEVPINSLDDIENGIAYNEDLVSADDDAHGYGIIGSDMIYVGSTNEYKFTGSNAWDLNLEDYKMVEFVSNGIGKCEIKCKSDSKYIGKTIELKAYNRNGDIIGRKTITIGGMF